MEVVAVAADHGGYELKKPIIDLLTARGQKVIDLGTNSADPVDYPDYARAIGKAILDGQANIGILLCGSGVGASVAANKIPGIRAGLCHDTYSAHQCREHDDVNVLCLGARVIGVEVAYELVKTFVEAKFSGEPRHVRRLEKVLKLEAEGLKTLR